MNKIKFSHMYNKLNSIDIHNTVKLIECEAIALSYLPDEFIDYDTSYIDGDVKKNYPLKDGSYLLLFFMDSKGSLFTTIRRYTEEKANYYMTSIGCMFEVVINK